MLYMVTFTIHIPQNTPNVSIYTIHGILWVISTNIIYCDQAILVDHWDITGFVLYDTPKSDGTKPINVIWTGKRKWAVYIRGQKSNCHVYVNIHLQNIYRLQFLYWHCALHLTFVCFCSTAAKLPCNELASSFRVDALALADAPLFDGPIGLGPKRARRWLAAAISAARGIRPQNFVWTCCDNGLA